MFAVDFIPSLFVEVDSLKDTVLAERGFVVPILALTVLLPLASVKGNPKFCV